MPNDTVVRQPSETQQTALPSTVALHPGELVLPALLVDTIPSLWWCVLALHTRGVPSRSATSPASETPPLAASTLEHGCHLLLTRMETLTGLASLFLQVF